MRKTIPKPPEALPNLPQWLLPRFIAALAVITALDCGAFILILKHGSSAAAPWLCAAVAVLSSLLLAGFVLLCVYRVLRPVSKLSGDMVSLAKGSIEDFVVERPELIFTQEVSKLTYNFATLVYALKGIRTLHKGFVASFSHEFRVPITSINGFSRLLGRPDISDESKREYIDIINTESMRLSHIAGDVQLLFQIDDVNYELVREDFYLDESIRKAALLLASRIDEKGIELHIRLSPMRYNGQSSLLYQIWVNLLDNAIKFTPSGGTICISGSADDEYAIVTISDSGPGIPPEKQERIFESFYSAPARSGGGTGLGLSIARKIAELHGGSIKVESQNVAGAAFSVRLPINAKPDLSAPGETPTAARTQS